MSSAAVLENSGLLQYLREEAIIHDYGNYTTVKLSTVSCGCVSIFYQLKVVMENSHKLLKTNVFVMSLAVTASYREVFTIVNVGKRFVTDMCLPPIYCFARATDEIMEAVSDKRLHTELLVSINLYSVC
ncbi:hypothetical protein F2P81_021009 [Scophthalmus maximus]|uniref:Uncharacterized protein n=1 Tax=Scophthalmus maximus TaxID=52904 RepID=A0A6A4S4M1_SCOMX|nr:hypothetical protein F2P81_021009 [Scophthalmus maximus]